MLTYYSDDHHLHHGKCELIDGQLMPCFEKPQRADHILARVQHRQRRLHIPQLQNPAILAGRTQTSHPQDRRIHQHQRPQPVNHRIVRKGRTTKRSPLQLHMKIPVKQLVNLTTATAKTIMKKNGRV